MKDVFSTYHPAISFLYFLVVLIVSMFVTHPVYMVLSFAAACSYALLLQGWRKTLKTNLLFMLPMMLMVALVNPLFNHYGVTVLFSMQNGKPVTLEAIAYGLAMAGILAEVVMWFSCYNKVMTSDKFVYLFGRIIPGLSLVLAMCLRFVPKFSKQVSVISNGQKCIGRDISNGTIVQRARHGITILSIMITWSLENAIDTADSMKARGYGLKGRKAFSVFRFDSRDKALLVGMILLSAGIFAGILHGDAAASYNPKIVMSGVPLTLTSGATMMAFAIFAFMPMILQAEEAIKWHFMRKRICEKATGGYRTWEY